MAKPFPPRDRWDRPMGTCDNPLCDRWVPQGILYCCHPCDLAHQRNYKIHEDGNLLGHSEGCIKNFKERGSTRPTEVSDG